MLNRSQGILMLLSRNKRVHTVFASVQQYTNGLSLDLLRETPRGVERKKKKKKKAPGIVVRREFGKRSFCKYIVRRFKR